MEKSKKILIGIFLAVLLIRLILAFIVPNLTYESYYNLRQVESIKETGLPLYHDDLSYGGRDILFLPLFHYLMAFFSLFLPLMLVAKIIPNLLVASITITTYFISKKISKNETAALLSALLAGFLPVLFTTNSFTVETLSLPLTFLVIYAFLNINSKKYLYIYILSFLLLSLTSSSALLLLIGFGIYMLLSVIEGKKINPYETEIILFSLFFLLWTQFIFYKNSLISKGAAFIWQNVPGGIMSQYFPKFSLAEALVLVSILPFLVGAFVVYKSLFQLKNQKSFLLISFVIATTLFTWLRLIMFRQSLAFFGVILAILFASFYEELEKYLRKTKLSYLKEYLLPVIIALLLITTMLPAINASLQQGTPSDEEIAAFEWLDHYSPKKSAVLATLEEGHLVTYYGQRKNIMDDQFRQIGDIDQRLQNLNDLFTTRFQTQALSLAEEYNIKYIVLTPWAKEKYGLSELSYATKRCFELVYRNETEIYRVKCELKEISG